MTKILLALFSLIICTSTYVPVDILPSLFLRTCRLANTKQGSLSLNTEGGKTKKQDDDVLRVETSLVTVPVSVFDRDGKFVSNLRKEDFRVFENGKEQEIAYFEPVEKPFTVLLMLDTSDSTLFRLEDIQNAAIAFIEQLRPDDRVIVVSFSNVLSILSEPTSDREILRDAIRRTRMGGGTSLYRAVDFAINRILGSMPGRKAIILFTDGADSGSSDFTLGAPHATFYSTLENAEEADALIYPVQYDTLKNMLLKYDRKYHKEIRRQYEFAGKYLNNLAEKTGGRVYRADSLLKLSEAYVQIADELRRQYSLGYYPKETMPKGVRLQIKVKLNRPGLAIRARNSYIKD